MQYLPYGEMFVQRGDLNFSPKFNSQELDRESGFYFFNARFYDPGIARFTSADSVIDGEFDTQGWNRFSYVKGNPIGAKDPTGHEIFISGDDNYKKEVAKDLSKLSGSKIDVDKTGKANMRQEIQNTKSQKIEIPQKPIGNKLVTGLMNSDKTIIIKKTDGGNGANTTNRIAAQNGQGSNAEIKYNLNANPKIPTLQKNGSVKFESRPKEIGLAHELIHSEHITKGTVDTGIVEQKFMTSDKMKYKDNVMKEELRTVGTNYMKKGDITENMIRKENGLKLRAAY
ncbi:RHS repeat-associated core domain-containing protein, partial [Leptospira kirschneri]|uniref:RHS repeat-associated core domain protein n=1 Tax=Leptospira kirschneri str. 200802841 TaxID=1193047 RepID=A0A828XY14_9LEPT